jgi:hypothetical protein
MEAVLRVGEDAVSPATPCLPCTTSGLQTRAESVSRRRVASGAGCPRSSRSSSARCRGRNKPPTRESRDDRGRCDSRLARTADAGAARRGGGRGSPSRADPQGCGEPSRRGARRDAVSGPQREAPRNLDSLQARIRNVAHEHAQQVRRIQRAPILPFVCGRPRRAIEVSRPWLGRRARTGRSSRRRVSCRTGAAGWK